MRTNLHEHTGEDGEDFLPVYPDDYIFFGQKLSYALYDNIGHDLHPVAAVKETTTQSGSTADNSKSGLLTDIADKTNRIYRAPAYFRKGEFGRSVIFNKAAAFAASAKVAKPKKVNDDGTQEYDDNVIPWDGYVPLNEPASASADKRKSTTYYPHKDMTAVDFTGHGDDTWQRGDWTKVGSTTEADKSLYKPLTDFDSIIDIRTSGLTQNLLAYAPADPTSASGTTSTSKTTTQVLTDYFKDPTYAETNSNYRNVAGKPYLVGFPGAMYYGFDLSGTFQPANTSSTVTTDEAKRDAQTITFASFPGATVAVSDTECATGVDQDGYVFMPTYLNNDIKADDLTTGAYVLNTDGSSFDKTSTNSNSAFRPYFKVAPGGSAKGEKTRSIIFGSGEELQGEEPGEPSEELADGDLFISGRNRSIVVKSTKKEDQKVTITNMAGIVVANFTIQPGDTRVTPVHQSGVYIVNKKKLSVK